MTYADCAVVAFPPNQSGSGAVSTAPEITGARGGDGVGEAVVPSPVEAEAEQALDFDEFYAANFRVVAVQLYAYFGDMGDAHDVTQEAFTRAWQRWSKVSGYGNPVAWVRT